MRGLGLKEKMVFWLERSGTVPSSHSLRQFKPESGPEHIGYKIPAMWYGSYYQYMLVMTSCPLHRLLKLVREDV